MASATLEMEFRLRIGVLDMHIALPAAPGTTVVIGPNGAGKTTLLRTLLGDITPSSGTITLGDDLLFSSSKDISLPLQARGLGYVPQRYALFPHLSVRNNVAFGLHELDRAARKGRVDKLLEDFDIAHLAERKPRALSGGEAQRVALARALAIEPRALLLDEPMGALDATARKRVRKVLKAELNAVALPTVIVTHDVEDVVALADRVAVLEAGQVVQSGTVDELKMHPASAFVAELLGSEPEPQL